MKLTNILLVLILSVTAVNLLVSLLIPSDVINLLGDRENMPSQTLKATANVKINGSTISVPIEITTTQGEDTPDNVHTPPEDETTAEWNTRTLNTLKSAYDAAVAFGT